MKSILLLIATLFVNLSLAIDLSDSHFDKYPNLIKLGGIHKASITQQTPPSTKTISWYINIFNSKSKSNSEIDVSSCPTDSQICGLTEVTLPSSKDPLLTEVFSFSNKLNPSFEEANNSLIMKLTGSNWGSITLDSEIEFICGEEENIENGFTVDSFDYSTLKLSWRSKFACIADDSSDDPSQSKPKKGSGDVDDSKGWGFFTWLFILMVLVLASYIIGQAWINSNRIGGSHEFLSELVDSIIDSLSKLPEFLKEIIGKFTGGNNRGGYSAV